MATVRFIHNVLFRKLAYDLNESDDSSLRRCLGLWDLTSLGLGSTLGVGIYVLVGAVALKFAGPSIVLSFFIAALASIFAGLCYAEFGARVPKAGSTYVYTYVTIGELVAFVIGWNVILEGFFGTASIAKGLSNYMDSMVDGVISAWFIQVFPISVPWFCNYFDLMAFCIILILGVIMAIGARKSTNVNNFFSILNLSVILFVIIAGSFTAKVSNWSIPASQVPAGKGTGGFFPYGIWGTLQGAALCFYGFTGFEAISASGEEVREPRKTIPRAIIIVLCIVLLVYGSVSTVITMMMPYYMLDKVAATALAFKYVGWDWARWAVSCGAVAGIFGSLFGCLFPVTRLLYAMANDGLIIHCFGYVSSTKKTPLFAIAVTSCIVAILASTMELEDLILMMAVGTLSSYTIVAICVIILRYQSNTTAQTKSGYFKQVLGIGSKEVSPISERIVNITLFLFLVVCLVEATVAIKITSATIPIAILNAVIILLLIIITLQPQAQEHLKFKTPLVPLIPCLSIYINIHLMLLVNIRTWVRVAIWLAIGIPIYFICLYCYKRPENNFVVKPNVDHSNKNGALAVQIVVQSPTPPGTLNQNKKTETDHTTIFKLDEIKLHDNVHKQPISPFKEADIIVQQAVIENNEEKEAKIIDLLDQVLQAEEDSYLEKLSLIDEIPEQAIMIPIETPESIPHRKSLSELSDAGSETSLSTQDTKYNVIAQVHREDLPKVTEEEEKIDQEAESPNIEAVNDTTNETTNDNVSIKEPTNNEHELLTSFNDSETNSRTDESGYSDTLDRNILNDSVEEIRTRDEVLRIPTPPPMDETYFNSPYVFKKANTISFVRPNRQISVEQNEEEEKPRESVQSNTSQVTDDGNIVFGSSRQMKFMNKLNNIFQHKIVTTDDDNLGEGEQHRKRSNSTGDVDNSEIKSQLIRPLIFFELKKELEAASVPNLRSVRKVDSERLNNSEPTMHNDDDDAATEDSSMSREDLKSRLENIFATGGPKLMKPRLMKSNPPTPEEVFQADTSSTESTPQLPKMEKNDTLKRQKDKFGDVLNSFRLSFNNEDAV